MTNDSICALFCDTQWLEFFERTWFFFHESNFEAIPWMLTRMSFHSATAFKDYNSLLILQSLLFKVNITNKKPSL